MRKVVLALHASLDGIVEGPNGTGDIQWISYDDDLAKHAYNLFKTVDTILWGRGTYHIMKDYWPTVPSNPSAKPRDVEHSKWLDRTTKIVFSSTLDNIDWVNSRLVKDNAAEEIMKLKQQPGKDIMILGSPGLAHTLMQLDLIDEYQITVSPVVVGRGLPLFKGIDDKLRFKLLDSKTLPSGVVCLHYQVQQ
ncbi:dihydrofolate reductase family protein [Paenibacillus lignilyticus]|uniref:Dihydrofolate reductase n=1 Tax=Paenibacillus lignilyticus TaxID=1172615 RepID=A0ABS5C9E2_9BACL|nr:dihydrofolate reductase family protein [Paenibacillus lignilyticus]MBP3962617.1 dihydrofolate reductase [Paenibacillus lignilyticus]